MRTIRPPWNCGSSILSCPTALAEKAGMRRIIDESGEDYLYPQDYFVDIKLPSAVAKIVRLAS